MAESKQASKEVSALEDDEAGSSRASKERRGGSEVGHTLTGGAAQKAPLFRHIEAIDPHLVSYEDWIALHQKLRHPPIRFEIEPLGQAAKVCLVPILNGGPDPPVEKEVYDPKLHAAPVYETNPWEICAQLHCGEQLERVLVQKRDAFRKERKKFVSVCGEPGCGKTTWIQLVLGVSNAPSNATGSLVYSYAANRQNPGADSPSAPAAGGNGAREAQGPSSAAAGGTSGISSGLTASGLPDSHRLARAVLPHKPVKMHKIRVMEDVVAQRRQTLRGIEGGSDAAALAKLLTGGEGQSGEKRGLPSSEPGGAAPAGTLAVGGSARKSVVVADSLAGGRRGSVDVKKQKIAQKYFYHLDDFDEFAAANYSGTARPRHCPTR
eukprot:gene255-318_t